MVEENSCETCRSQYCMRFCFVFGQGGGVAGGSVDTGFQVMEF